MTIKGLRYAALVLVGMLSTAGCEDMRALEAQLSRNIDAHPLGPLGPGLDMYTASEQIWAAKRR